MKPVGEHAEQRRIRERAIARRKKELGYKLKLIADELCESHSAASHNELIEYGLAALLNCMRRPTLTSGKCEALAQHFKDCPYREEYLNEVQVDGHMIMLEGRFDIFELAKRILWIAVEEQYLVTDDDDSRWGYDAGIEISARLLSEVLLTSEMTLEFAELIVAARAFVNKEEAGISNG